VSTIYGDFEFFWWAFKIISKCVLFFNPPQIARGKKTTGTPGMEILKSSS
jgi:hypothetical protein